MALGRWHSRDIYDREKVTGPLLCIRSVSNQKSEKHGTPSKLSSNLLSSMEYQVLITYFIPQLQTHWGPISQLSLLGLGPSAVSEAGGSIALFIPGELRSQENEGIQEVFVVFWALGPFTKIRKDPVNSYISLWEEHNS